MIKNYLILSIRKFRRQKLYSLVNLFGLTIGLTSVMLIMLYVIDEVSFDRFHEKANRIYRVVENQYYAGQPVFPVAVTPCALGPSLKEEFSAVEQSSRFMNGSTLFENGDLAAIERGAYADEAFLDIFSFELIYGEKATALKELGNVVLSEKMAIKYFGEVNCVGKMLRINSTREAIVAGVMKDFPDNSHIKADYLIPFESFLSRNPDMRTSWGSNMLYTYVLLKPGTDVDALNEQIIGQIKKNNEGSITDIYLQPLTDIHLGSVFFTADVQGKGNAQYVAIFTVVALFILVIACINFMNLATARSMRRAKEVGLRKTVGARRGELIFQFLSESLATAMIAMAISVLLVDLLLPQFNLISGKNLDLNLNENYLFFLGLIGLATFTGLAAGSYPALFLSAFQPGEVLKAGASKSRGGAGFRKVLVVVQFCISIVMIAGTLVVYRQIEFIRAKDLGYSKENIIKMPRVSNDHQAFKNELLKRAGVLSVTATNQHPAYVENSSSGFRWEGYNPDDVILFHLLAVDYDFVETMDVTLKAGRDFSPNFPSDTTAILLNEQAVSIMNLKDPIGQAIDAGDSIPYRVVGVVKDFHFKSIHQRIEPLIIFLNNQRDNLDYTLIRTSSGDPSEHVAIVESTWNSFNPGREFVFTFLDDDFNDLYQAEEQTGVVFKLFSSLAILISCLGLFGLASFTMEQRTKEFGVRKVFGASFVRLFSTASGGFLLLVCIAFGLSVPLSWYFINLWLAGFAYHISAGVEVFFISGLIALAIALATVSYQSVKSALVNPAESLRHE
ncbi:MAG: ABC transporter permease [Cyclobacteriaceae bacterium]